MNARTGTITLQLDSRNHIDVAKRHSAVLDLTSQHTSLRGGPLKLSYRVSYPVGRTVLRILIGACIGAVILSLPRWLMTTLGAPGVVGHDPSWSFGAPPATIPQYIRWVEHGASLGLWQRVFGDGQYPFWGLIVALLALAVLLFAGWRFYRRVLRAKSEQGLNMASDGQSENGESALEARQRRPLVFGCNPRINFTRLGCGGWVVLILLVGLGVYFHKYTVAGLYTGVAAAGYSVSWSLDWFFSADRMPRYPWAAWAAWGALFGAALGFWTIAPLYGLRRWLWPGLAALGVAAATVALLPIGVPAAPPRPPVPHTLGPVVRVSGPVMARQGHSAALGFIVFDQSRKAKVDIVVTRYETTAVVARLQVRWVRTGTWLKQTCRCTLQPGRYRFVVQATDALGHPAVHSGVGSLRVRD